MFVTLPIIIVIAQTINIILDISGLISSNIIIGINFCIVMAKRKRLQLIFITIGISQLWSGPVAIFISSLTIKILFGARNQALVSPRYRLLTITRDAIIWTRKYEIPFSLLFVLIFNMIRVTKVRVFISRIIQIPNHFSRVSDSIIESLYIKMTGARFLLINKKI